MSFLTSRTLATGVTGNDLFHIVKPYDNSQNPDGSSYKATINQVFDSMSGYCIPIILVSRIGSCGKLEINKLDEGNVYVGSTSALTVDLSVNSVGINRPSPQYTLDISGNTNIDYFNTNLKLFDNNTSAGSLRLSGTSGNLEEMIVFAPVDGTGNIGGVSIGVRGFTAPFPGYGSNGDVFLYGSFETNGLNIIKARSGSFPNNPNYIRFYAGESATNPPHMHIQGSGSTRGFIGIGTSSPSERLDVIGKTKTVNFQMTSGSSENYIMKSIDNLGNGVWSKSRNWGSFISTADQTPGIAGTTYKMSADTTVGSSGVQLSANTRFVVSTPGVYNIQFSAQVVKTANQPSSIYIWLSKDGTPISYTNTEFTMPQGSNERVVAAWNWVDETTNPNSYYEIEWAVTNAIVTMDHDSSPIYGPEIPSLKVTVTQA